MLVWDEVDMVIMGLQEGHAVAIKQGLWEGGNKRVPFLFVFFFSKIILKVDDVDKE